MNIHFVLSTARGSDRLYLTANNTHYLKKGEQKDKGISMIPLPPRVCRQYRLFSAENGVGDSEFAGHLKCMRYFRDV